MLNDFFLKTLPLLAGVLYLPPLFLPLLKLENYNTRRKYLIHYLIALAVIVFSAYLIVAPGFLEERGELKLLWTLLVSFFALEISARIAICLAARLFPKKLGDFKLKWIDLSCYGDPLETRIQAHPFLQFTGRIGKPAGFQRRRAYGDYGFVGISASDIPRPQETIRIACLGGSTTEYGYPALLEEELRKTAPEKKFQVLNFGLSWWTTIHSVVNYVLNVRDFKPHIVVIHHNVNDHKYRGYPSWRGDGAHAFVPWHYRGAPDRYLIHFSVVYRFLRLRVQAIYRLLPKFGDFPEAADKYSQILQKKGKALTYDPKELAIFRRNIETIINLAKVEGSKVILTTMPFSQNYDDPTHLAIKRHMIEVNALLRQIASEQNAPLVDLDKTASEESFFLDMVHVTPEGDRKKALEIGKCILAST
ncbi:MAG: SGNH/GDSL hydrolase family protein [Bdellovibrionota bacterium]